MNDMSSVIVAKSDQWNADDFVDGPRTFTIEAVQIRPGTEQPVQITLAGSRKFFRPCKTVSRVLVAAWKADANVYIGRSLTLYTDPDVTWGGLKTGGIRVSHLSHMNSPLVIALQEKKGSRRTTTIQPLKVEQPAPADDPALVWATDFIAGLDGLRTVDGIAAHEANNAKPLAKMEKQRPDLRTRIQQAVDARFAAVSAEGKPDDAFGDQIDGTEERITNELIEATRQDTPA